MEQYIKCALDINNTLIPNSNNGLTTTLWGPHAWITFHAITFGYPINPTEQQKIKYLKYFKYFGFVLPCEACSNSYQSFIQNGITLLNMDTMSSRGTLTKWGYNVHEAVNSKLGVTYGITYEDVCYKYNAYRSECSLDSQNKINQIANTRVAPIIDITHSISLINYALTLNLHNYENQVYYNASLKKYTPEWYKKNKLAIMIINYMRKNNISSLTHDGMPSLHEMLLISMGSTTLTFAEIRAVIIKNKLYNIEKII